MRIVQLCLAALPLSITAMLSASPAKADFLICNRSNYTAQAVFAYYEAASDSFISRGWYTVKPGKCYNVYEKSLPTDSTWYLYADDPEGGYWRGDVQLCTYEDAFKAYDADKKCPGGVWRGFRKVYTRSGGDFTFNLRN